MRRWPITLLMPIMLAFCLGKVTAASRDSDPTDPSEFEFQFEQLGGTIRPYQAVRLRFTLRNIGRKRIGPVQLDYGGALSIKAPNQDAYYRPSGHMLVFDRDRSPGGTSAITPRETMNSRASLLLDQDERISASLAFAACWRDVDGRRLPAGGGQAIFEEPGEYLIKCRFRADPKHGEYIERVLKVHVLPPEGQDKAVCELLDKDAVLASALMRPVDAPDKEVFPKIKDIVERYPESSYADYARFALARGYLRGIGISPHSQRVAWALAADQLEKVIQDRYDPKVRKFLPKDFAYMPNALILMRLVDLHAKEASLLRLHQEYTDALEWIEEFASLLTRADHMREQAEFVLKRKFPAGTEETSAFMADAWREFRKQPPMPRKRSDVRP